MDSLYEVINPLTGSVLLQAHVSRRYKPETELSILDAGYIIKIDGKKLTKAEIRKELGRKPCR